MHDFSILKDLLVILALIISIIFLAHHLKFPSIIGFLISGVIIGPNALGWVQDPSSVNFLAEIGIVLLLFSIGMDFSIEKLIGLKRLLFLAGGGQVLVTLFVTMVVGFGFGIPIGKAILIGCMIALSSTAVVLKILGDRKDLNGPMGRMAMTILLFQDLCIVPMMLLIPYLGAQGDVDWLEIGSTLAISITGIIVILFGARILIPKLLGTVIKLQNRELFLMTTLFITFGTAWLGYAWGLSLALGAFLAGLIISESEYSYQIVADIMPMKDLLIALFFISIGMLIDISFLRLNYLLLILTVVGIIAFKSLLVLVLTYLLKYPARLGLAAGLAVSQIGEFSFIVALTGKNLNLLDAIEYQIFLSASIMTMVASPFLISNAMTIGEKFQRVMKLPESIPWRLGKLSLESAGDAASEQEETLKGHAVVIGYSATGEYLCNVLHDTGIPYQVCEFLYDRFEKAKSRHPHVLFGDATAAPVMERMHLDAANILVVTTNQLDEVERIIRLAKSINPNLYTIAHTRTVNEIEQVYKFGANYVVPEELETTIEMLALVLRQYHVPRNVIASQVAIIRQDKYRPIIGEQVSAATLDQLPFILAATTTEAGMILENSPCVGKTVASSGLKETGVSLLAIVRDGKPISNPADDFVFQKGDVLIMIGSHADIDTALGVVGCEIVS